MIEPYILHSVLPGAYSLLPPQMHTPGATAEILAIGWQESKFEHRRQVLTGGGLGRGRSFWQFERDGGVAGVLTHQATRTHIQAALATLRYPASTMTPEACHAIIEHHDVLACVFARLLLWTLPGRLPTASQATEGWRQYIAGWRPGKPHPETWVDNFEAAWALVKRAPLVAPMQETA